jgi:hypothetical protein
MFPESRAVAERLEVRPRAQRTLCAFFHWLFPFLNNYGNIRQHLSLLGWKGVAKFKVPDWGDKVASGIGYPRRSQLYPPQGQ